MEIKKEKIAKIEKIPYQGYLYNLTTETGNLFVNNILVSNSGGLGTPAYQRLVPGMIHRANGGVLFIDEIANLRPESQQELLTAVQEKKYPITGQSERSSGAMVRSEPVPCFPEEVKIVTEKGEIKIGQFIDKLLNQNKDRIIQQNNLEILKLNNKKYQVYSWKNNNILKDNIIALSRRKFKGKLIEIEFDDGTRIISTPDHPIKIKKGFIEAKKLKVGNKVASAKRNIINENSIIETYSKENQRIAKVFLTWQNLFNINKNRLYCKNLNIDAKTEYSWKKGIIPRALKPVYFLKEKKLLPLNLSNKKITIISRVCGALLGDGGISQNLKKIYFSTDKKSIKDLLAFKKDILLIFGNNLEKNIKIRKNSRGKGEGLEISINNAFTARFFYSLGIPKGDKVSQPIKIPEWIKFNDKCKTEFFSTLLDCEIYAKLSRGSIKDTPHFSMSKIKKYEKEHILFLNELESFLNSKGIKTIGIAKSKVYLKSKNLKETTECARYILKLSSDYENLKKLYSLPWNYATYKKQEIKKLVKRGIPYLKHKKYCLETYPKAINMVNKGATIKKAAKLFNISRHTLWYKMPPIYNSYTIEKRNKVKNLLKERKLPKEISNQLNIPYTTVLSWRKKV